METFDVIVLGTGAAALTAAIREATTRPSYRARAQALAGRLAGEDGTGPVIEAVSRLRR